jgi:hypothetical protein
MGGEFESHQSRLMFEKIVGCLIGQNEFANDLTAHSTHACVLGFRAKTQA